VLLAVVAIVAAAASSVLSSGCGGESRQTLKLLYAGSMIVPFERLAADFQARHPDVKVLTESHGSVQCIRQVTELHRRFDVLVSADYSLMPPMMYDVEDEASGRPYADWTIRFATNRIVLAYTDRSEAVDELTEDNWYEILTRPEVRFGIADPRFDAAGYRSLMVLQLAEGYYDDPIILENLAMAGFSTPVVGEREDDLDVIIVPELLETVRGGPLVLRGSSVQLLPLLQSGDVDYALEYESVARQHGLEYLELPPQIDLGDPEYADLYASVEVRIDMQRFKTVKPVFRGEVIGYGVTIPTNAPDAPAAEQFVEFLLGPAGRRIMGEAYQPLIEPPAADRLDDLPAALRALVVDPGASPAGTAPSAATSPAGANPSSEAATSPSAAGASPTATPSDGSADE
jgi:molybdate/tungstate transport system substrate-binding protein